MDNDKKNYHRCLLDTSHEALKIKNKLFSNIEELNSAFSESSYDSDDDNGIKNNKKQLKTIQDSMFYDWEIINNLDNKNELCEVDENDEPYYPYTIKINNKNKTEFWIESFGLEKFNEILKDLDIDNARKLENDHKAFGFAHNFDFPDNFNKFELEITPEKNSDIYYKFKDDKKLFYKGKENIVNVSVRDFFKTDGYISVFGYTDAKKEDFIKNLKTKYGNIEVNYFDDCKILKNNIDKTFSELKKIVDKKVVNYKSDIDYDFLNIKQKECSSFLYLTRKTGSNMLRLDNGLYGECEPSASIEFFINHNDYNGLYYCSTSPVEVKDITKSIEKFKSLIENYNKAASLDNRDGAKIGKVNDAIDKIYEASGHKLNNIYKNMKNK